MYEECGKRQATEGSGLKKERKAAELLVSVVIRESCKIDFVIGRHCKKSYLDICCISRVVMVFLIL